MGRAYNNFASRTDRYQLQLRDGVTAAQINKVLRDNGADGLIRKADVDALLKHRTAFIYVGSQFIGFGDKPSNAMPAARIAPEDREEIFRIL